MTPEERQARAEAIAALEPRQMNDEANAFAMELLMPTKFLIKEIRDMGGVSIDDDEKMDRLARKFKVQVQILALRLLKLDDELRSDDYE